MKPICDPKDRSIKSFFLGPQAENELWLSSSLNQVLKRWMNWRKSVFPEDGVSISIEDQNHTDYIATQNFVNQQLQQLLDRLERELPKFTPRYNGHMISEVSIPALLGHFATILHNPNITTAESSPVVSVVEKEAIQDLCHMVGFTQGVGHFTSGGTIANFEAILRSRHRLYRNLCLAIILKNRGEEVDWFQMAHLPIQTFEHLLVQHSVSSEMLKSIDPSVCGILKFSKIFKQAFHEDFQGAIIIGPHNKHFSWPKGAAFLGLGADSFWGVPLDAFGKMDLNILKLTIEKAKTEKKPVQMIFSVLGTTELGEIDPIDQIQNLISEYQRNELLYFWHHVDGAYGAYYCSMVQAPIENHLEPSVFQALSYVGLVDSVTIDPHKLGYVPYACGAILIRDRLHYPIGNFSAPYLQSQTENTWAYTIEGSRAGTGAVATWLSNKAVGLNAKGYGRILDKGILARIELEKKLREDFIDFLFVDPSETNILCFSARLNSDSLSVSNQRSQFLYEAFLKSPNFSVSKTILKFQSYEKMIRRICHDKKITIDSDELFLIRVVIMNPFFISKESRVNYVDLFSEETKRLFFSITLK